MKKRIITIILSSLLVVSIGINIWQFNNNNSLNTTATALQDDINNLKVEMDSHNNAISEKDAEITKLSTSIEEMKAENENLKTAVDDATAKGTQIAELNKTIEELNATIDELKAEIETLKKASETKTQQSSQSRGNTGTQQQQQQPPADNGYDPNQGNGAPGTFGSIPVKQGNDGSNAGYGNLQ